MQANTYSRFGNILGRVGFAGFMFFLVKGLLWLSVPVLAANWF